MPRSVFVHETIDIVGQGQYEYMDLAAREPVHDMPGLFRLQGTFYHGALQRNRGQYHENHQHYHRHQRQSRLYRFHLFQCGSRRVRVNR